MSNAMDDYVNRLQGASDHLIKLLVRLERLEEQLAAGVRPGHADYLSKKAAAAVLRSEIEAGWKLYPHLNNYPHLNKACASEAPRASAEGNGTVVAAHPVTGESRRIGP